MQLKFFDLSCPINEDLHVWPGLPGVSFRPIQTIEKNGSNVTKVSFATHVGTHLDAPHHMIQSGLSVDMLPLDSFMGNAVLIDVSGIITDQRIKPEKELLDSIHEGDIVIVKTNKSDHLEISLFPSPSITFGKLLVEKHIKLYCTDAPSVDDPEGQDFVFHKLMFSNNIPIVEGLVNLASLPKNNFFLIALPLKLSGLDGSPCRVVAIEGLSYSNQ